MKLEIRITKSQGKRELGLYSEDGKLIIFRKAQVDPADEPKTDWTPLATAFGRAIGASLAIHLKGGPADPEFEDDEIEDYDSWQPCDNCDLPDACADFGCAIKQGLKEDPSI